MYAYFRYILYYNPPLNRNEHPVTLRTSVFVCRDLCPAFMLLNCCCVCCIDYNCYLYVEAVSAFIFNLCFLTLKISSVSRLGLEVYPNGMPGKEVIFASHYFCKAFFFCKVLFSSLTHANPPTRRVVQSCN